MYMKTVAIELDDELERQIELLSEQEGRDQAAIILELLQLGLTKKKRRQEVGKALEEVFSMPVTGPFTDMTDEEIMAAVRAEVSL